MVNGYGPIVGAALSDHRDVAMMSFTGSTEAGIAVAQASAVSVKRVHQELGGKSSNIVLDDVADLEKSANMQQCLLFGMEDKTALLICVS